MSHSENEANLIASELKVLPMEALEVMVWPEKARVELVTCAPTRRQRPVMARPWWWWLACCKATAEVRGVLRRVQLSRGCAELAQGALVVRLADGAHPSGLMDPASGDSKLEHRMEL